MFKAARFVVICYISNRKLIWLVWGGIFFISQSPIFLENEVISPDLEELQKPPREGNGKPLQYSCLENPMDGGAW